eukprot:GHVR01113248.1.p1 GENE.GHVR01113248.1~~GHVR01113248.1.p1  ORF type:complete len:441 (+),score=119.01 GHVR01113248.1:372-1694(+)
MRGYNKRDYRSFMRIGLTAERKSPLIESALCACVRVQRMNQIKAHQRTVEGQWLTARNDKIRRQEEVAKKLRIKKDEERRMQARQLFDDKCDREKQLQQDKEKQIGQMEKEEIALIQRLYQTQQRQRAAYELLEVALAPPGEAQKSATSKTARGLSTAPSTLAKGKPPTRPRDTTPVKAALLDNKKNIKPPKHDSRGSKVEGSLGGVDKSEQEFITDGATADTTVPTAPPHPQLNHSPLPPQPLAPDLTADSGGDTTGASFGPMQVSRPTEELFNFIQETCGTSVTMYDDVLFAVCEDIKKAQKSFKFINRDETGGFPGDEKTTVRLHDQQISPTECLWLNVTFYMDGLCVFKDGRSLLHSVDTIEDGTTRENWEHEEDIFIGAYQAVPRTINAASPIQLTVVVKAWRVKPCVDDISKLRVVKKQIALQVDPHGHATMIT